MKCFDIHSDIWNDVTVRRLKGESSVFRQHHADRLKKGNVEGSIFVIWVDPPYDADYMGRTNQIMNCVNDEVREAEAAGDFRIVHNYSEMMTAREDGVTYIFHGIEGLAAIGEDVDLIDKYYDFGCRHAILTWNESNALGGGALSGNRQGLTACGKKAVKKIQDKGMILDVSHLNAAGFWDIVDITSKPFIASHSNSSALCSVLRNLTDDQLRAIRDVNGLVGINSFNLFVDADPRKQTVEKLAQHVAHMIDIMGIDHVACGFDFFEFIENDQTMVTMTSQGSPSTKGIADASEIPNLFACFRKMGMTDEEMEKIAYKNAHRIIKDCIG